MKNNLKKQSAKLSPRTLQIHGLPKSQAWEFSHHIVPPMTASTTFRLDSLARGAQGFSEFGNSGKKDPIWIYDRLEEPTTLMLEEQLSLMESSECAISFGSGMGAISATFLTLLKSKQKIIAHRTLYGCTYSLITEWLPKLGIDNELLDLNSNELIEKIKDPQTRIIYFESVSNPSLEIIDIPRIVNLVRDQNKKRSKENKIYVVVDNTFATPWALRPIEFGADFVIQSLTKNISGFGTEMGGAVMARKEFESSLRLARKDFGAMLHPSSAWHILVYGVPTQSLRFEKQERTAIKIAQFLERHPKIESVTYPGLKSHPQYRLAKKLLLSPEGEFSPGTMISFVLKGSMSKCEKFVDSIAKNSYSITLAVSLGMIKTLIEVPGFMTHAAIPKENQKKSLIDSRMIRLSIGLENAKDLIDDLDRALLKV